LHRKEKGGQGEDDLSMRVVPRESVEKSRPGANAPGLFECIGNSDPLYRRLAEFYFEFKKYRKRGRNMSNIISDETIEYVGILAKLELSEEEKEQAKGDMGKMLDYIDMLNELEIPEKVEAMSHIFPINNVFREDTVENGDQREAMLANAPEQKDGSYLVPQTVE
jgi:aspartyl-tRNA(Asn)/glutamyl-tRNA(Gln) amidotransferase subunit C